MIRPRLAMVGRLGLLGVSVLATLLGLEAGVRLAHPMPRVVNLPDFYAPDPSARYVLKPNTVKTVRLREFTYRMEINSRGFRGPEFSERPAPPTRRILLLGDSFTFGWGVDFESTYGHVLETALNRDAPEGRFEVINGGVPAYNTLNELKFLETRGTALQPDYVVVQLLINDDVRDNLVAGLTYRTVVDHTLFTTLSVERARNRLPPDHRLTAQDIMALEANATPRSLYERLKEPLHDYSHLYRFVVERTPNRWVEQLKAMLRAAGLFIQRDDTETLSREHIAVFETPRPPLIEEAVSTTRDYLRQLKLVADAGGARLLVVIFPSIFEVDPASRARLLERLGLDEGQIDVEGVKNHLLSYCAEIGIPALALHRLVRTQYDELQPYFPLDGHFNARGYRLAGEAVAEFLRNTVLRPANERSEP